MTDLALNRRQEELVALVRREGFAAVEALAAHFQVNRPDHPARPSTRCATRACCAATTAA